MHSYPCFLGWASRGCLAIVASFSAVAAERTTLADAPLLRQRLNDSVVVAVAQQPSSHFVFDGLQLRPDDSPQEHIRFVVNATQLADPPAVLGSFETRGGQLCFVPEFPLSRSVTYQLHLSAELRSIHGIDEKNLTFLIIFATLILEKMICNKVNL